MSFSLRRIELENFRKFRERTVIEDLKDGLNIVIEPNEAGKSTLLEALRAALFVRHSTRNKLASSFAPYQEAVAPQVEVAFDISGAPWSVTKRFLKSPLVELRGPGFRAQGDEAEAKLHELLGSTKDTSQQGDTATHGALGLLWVGQAAALEVVEPGATVRDTVRSTLEAEVGTILGGPAFERLRARIESQYAAYWTPTGSPARKLTETRDTEQAARTAAAAAATRLEALEQNFIALEAARSRLRILEREMADPADAAERTRLAQSLETARTAAQLLMTRKAEQEAADAALRGLEDVDSRYRKASDDAAAAEAALAKVKQGRTHFQTEIEAGKAAAGEARNALTKAREARTRARAAFASAQTLADQARQAAAIAAALKRYRELLLLEKGLQEAKAVSGTEIPAEYIANLEAGDRAVAEARAAVNAGATTIELLGDAPEVKIGGAPMPAGPQNLVGETRIELREGASLIVRPPATAQSAEARLTLAIERQQAALAELTVEDLSGARARNQTARDAAANIRTLEARVAGLTPPDAVIGISPGPEALKLFVSGLQEQDTAPVEAPASLDELLRASEAADLEVVRAEALQENAVDGLRSLEDLDRPLAGTEAGAERDLANAKDRMAEIEALPHFGDRETALVSARETAAAASVAMADAQRHAQAHDQEAISGKIRTIDARAKVAGERRTQLLQDVTRLETLVDTEGGKGLADLAAAAREEAEAAAAALVRVTEDADTLKLLRDVLEAARGEASRTFVGPVAKRAKRYIERLLPGCELVFNEDLGLDTLVRAGLSEGCGNLSRGTQEQLAILTRLAFADMLLDQGKPISLILDDPLVYSDDARLDTMTEILIQAADRMQVILLTCRDRAFRHLPANRIVMGSPARAA